MFSLLVVGAVGRRTGRSRPRAGRPPRCDRTPGTCRSRSRGTGRTPRSRGATCRRRGGCKALPTSCEGCPDGVPLGDQALDAVRDDGVLSGPEGRGVPVGPLSLPRQAQVILNAGQGQLAAVAATARRQRFVVNLSDG